MTKTWRVGRGMALKLSALVVVGLLQMSDAAAQAETRTMRIIVPYPPGGIADLLGRQLAARLSRDRKSVV